MNLTFENISEMLYEGIMMPFSYFLEPRKRLYFLYLLSSSVLAYIVFRKEKTQIPFIKYLFPKKLWFSNSAVVDYKMIFFNGIIKVLLIGPFLIYGLYLAF